MHTKHSNTVFPGDDVKVRGDNKLASAEAGKVVDANPDANMLKIAFASDGRTEWVDAAKVEKQ